MDKIQSRINHFIIHILGVFTINHIQVNGIFFTFVQIMRMSRITPSALPTHNGLVSNKAIGTIQGTNDFHAFLSGNWVLFFYTNVEL